MMSPLERSENCSILYPRTVLGPRMNRHGLDPVRLQEEPEEVEPPFAEHVEAVAWLLPAHYLIGLLVLESTGARIGEVEAARVGDLDERRRAWLMRAKVAKTRKARGVELPDDLYRVVLDRLPPREDAIRKRRCSRSRAPTTCGWRSDAPAGMRARVGRRVGSSATAFVRWQDRDGRGASGRLPRGPVDSRRSPE